MDRLKALRADLLTPEEKEELKRLEARYPDVPLDRTRDAPLASEAVRLALRARQADLIRRPADNRFRDPEQRGP
jgi:hypothetical protein